MTNSEQNRKNENQNQKERPMNAEQVVEQEQDQDTEQTVEVVNKDGYVLRKRTIKIKKHEFPYWDKAYTNFTKLVAEQGQEKVLAAVNSALNFSMRAKARNSLETDAEVELAAQEGRELLSQETAETFKIGEKTVRVTAKSLFEEAMKIAKEIKDIKVKNPTADTTELNNKRVELLKRSMELANADA